MLSNRGGAEDKRLKVKDTKNPSLRPRTAFPRTDPFEAKDRNARGQGQEPSTQALCFPTKNVSKNIFQAISKKKGLQKIFQLFSKNNVYINNFSSDLQVFNNLKNSAVLVSRTGEFSKT